MSQSSTHLRSGAGASPRIEASALHSDKEVFNENEKEVLGAEGLQAVPRAAGLELAGAEGLRAGLRREGLEIPGAEGIERVKDDDAKEAIGQDGMERVPSRGDGVVADEGPSAQHNGAPSKSKRRRRIVWLWVALVAVVITGVALGVGLGVGLRSSHASATPESPKNHTNRINHTSSLSQGAINGTGIAILGAGKPINFTSGALFPSDSQNNFYLCFQHSSGEIRWMIRVWPTTWLGGTADEVITTDAKLRTPLALLTPADESGSVKEWHLFYVSKDNKLRERVLSTATLLWADGLFNNLDVDVYNNDYVALRACHLSNIGDASPVYAHGGMRVWVGTGAETIDQYSTSLSLGKWVLERTWTNVSGQAAPDCWFSQSIDPSLYYAVFVSTNNTIDLYWRDDGAKNNGTASHPVKEWVPAPNLSISNMDPTSGLALAPGSSKGTNNLYAKIDGNNVMHNWNVSFAAENSTIVPGTPAEIPSRLSINGTHIAALSRHYTDGEVLLMYQELNGSITAYSETLPGGEWIATIIPIPGE